MAVCPSCHAQIEIGSEFFGGLFTCPSCRAVYFIGFDGVPENAQASYQNGEAQNNEEQDSESYQLDPNPQPPVDFQPIPYENFSLPNESENPVSTFESQPHTPTQNFEPVEQSFSNQKIDSYEPAMNAPPIMRPGQSPLQDVIDFANSEGNTSLATYSLEIHGLGSKENMDALKEVLTDSKIQLSFDQMKSQIKNGVLKLEKLNGAQAAVIAFRLRPLPLQMKWKQNIL